MKYKKALMVAVGFLIIAVIILIISLIKKPSTIVIESEKAIETTPVVTTTEPKMISIAQDSYLYGIGGSYPVFAQADDSFNKKIADIVITGVESFKQEANDNYKARLETGGADFEKQFSNDGMYTYDVKSEIIQSNDKFISGLLRIVGFSGGAHGYAVTISYNYDVVNKKEIGLDYFYPGNANYLKVISDASRVQLIEKLTKAGEQKKLDENIRSMMMEGTDPTNPLNFQSFTFTDDNLRIYFGQYQVAPYVYGEQFIDIKRK